MAGGITPAESIRFPRILWLLQVLFVLDTVATGQQQDKAPQFGLGRDVEPAVDFLDILPDRVFR